MISTKEIEEFKTKGYVVIRDFINQDEIKELSNSFQQSKKSKTDEEIYNVIDDEKIWKLLCNTKLNQIFNFLIGPNVKIYDDCTVIYLINTLGTEIIHAEESIGPDWIEDPRYMSLVLQFIFLIVYSNSALNVIPGSHFKNYKTHFLIY